MSGFTDRERAFESKFAHDTEMQFRAEAFNIPNHAQFNNPGNAVNSANFGMITAAKPVERQFRLGLRIGF